MILHTLADTQALQDEALFSVFFRLSSFPAKSLGSLAAHSYPMRHMVANVPYLLTCECLADFAKAIA